MPDRNLENLLKLYNPWWENPRGKWRNDLPDYQRPIVSDILSDIAELPQMISITGPRRVGKTTSLRQVICNLLDVQKVKPTHIPKFTIKPQRTQGNLLILKDKTQN